MKQWMYIQTKRTLWSQNPTWVFSKFSNRSKMPLCAKKKYHQYLQNTYNQEYSRQEIRSWPQIIDIYLKNLVVHLFNLELFLTPPIFPPTRFLWRNLRYQIPENFIFWIMSQSEYFVTCNRVAILTIFSYDRNNPSHSR